MAFKRIIHEVHRRSIWQVLLIYLGASWAVLQVVDQVQTRLALPTWVYGGAIILLLIGLPIVLATAFVQEGTTTTVTTDEAPLPVRVLTWRNALGGGLLAFIAGGAVLVLWLNFAPRDRAKEAAAAQPSIAVLPFVDMSPAKDQEYFGDGITEEILNVLAQLPNLRVPARTSSFSFKGKNLPIKDIAQQLGVATVLEGSIRKAGDRVRITAQLIDAKTDRHLWSETYDRDLSDVFAVQDEIAHAIVNALQLHMQQNVAGAPLVTKETLSGAAHEAYLKGLYHWHTRHTDELPMALEEMKRAAQEDPKYARAWAGIALTYAVLPQYMPYDRALAIREGKAAAKRALELDPNAADAHAALGQIAQELEWDWKSAAEHYDRAIALDPNFATAHQWRAETMVVLGHHDEALAEVERGLEIDPLSTVLANMHAFTLIMKGEPAKAEPTLKMLLERDPAFPLTRGNLIGAMWQQGKYTESIPFAADSGTRVIARGLADPAQRPAALRVLADPTYRATHALELVVSAYVGAGRPDLAAEALNQGADLWAGSLGYLVHGATSRSLTNEPQFKEFRRKLHL